MRSWMSEGTGYQQGIPLGEVMRGGGIARVLESRAEAFAPGDLVQARLGWQTHPTIPGRYLQKLDLAVPAAPAGGGVWGWGHDVLGDGGAGKDARALRALMSTTRRASG